MSAVADEIKALVAKLDAWSLAYHRVGDRPKVVLVGVGQNQAVDLLASTGNKSRVGHFDTRATRGAARGMLKGDAAIDQQPAAVVAVQVEIHADFPGSSQGQEPGGAGGRLGHYQA